MNDLHTLTDAFTELERQADAATLSVADAPLRTRSRHRTRLVPVAATAVTVLGVGTGAALLAHHDSSKSPAAAPPPATTSAALASSTVAMPARFHIPKTQAELAKRFRIVLGDTATFTLRDSGGESGQPSSTHARGAGPSTPRVVVLKPSGKVSAPAKGNPTSTNGAAIVGTLTAARHRGGFDLQIFRASKGDKAACDDPGESQCTIHHRADGSSLAVGSERLQGSTHGITYQVTLIRADGVEFLMHLSNERDPKGDSAVLSAHPPLTTNQMVSIVTSKLW